MNEERTGNMLWMCCHADMYIVPDSNDAEGYIVPDSNDADMYIVPDSDDADMYIVPDSNDADMYSKREFLPLTKVLH